MSSLDDWISEREKCLMSVITIKYPAGKMSIDFRSFLIENNFGINRVKRLVKLNRSYEVSKSMYRTVNSLIQETKTEYRHVMDDAEQKFDEIDNKYLFEMDREKAKKPIRKKRDAKRRELDGKYQKLLKLQNIIEEVM